MTKSLFITAIFNLQITEDLKDGIEIWDKIKITNNRKIINSLITENLEVSIGGLEVTALQNANAIFYAIDNKEINSNNGDEILCDYMGKCKIFLNDMWLFRDNCADLMMGYIEYPHFDKNSSILLPNRRIMVHSNSIFTGFSDSTGNSRHTVEFSKNEIEEVMKFFSNDNRTIIPFSETITKTTFLEKGMSRLTIGGALTQTARAQHDLGLKISHYCTALEALFTSDITELAHKLAERVAYFLETNFEKRKEIYKQIKDIYNVRSQVVHGSIITKKFDNLTVISKQADEILRRVFLKINTTSELDKYFRSNNSEGLEEYMTNLIFGMEEKTAPNTVQS